MMKRELGEHLFLLLENKHWPTAQLKEQISYHTSVCLSLSWIPQT